MPRTSSKTVEPAFGEPRPTTWYDVLSAFPFLFLPIVVLIGILCAVVMPYLTGVSGG